MAESAKASPVFAGVTNSRRSSFLPLEDLSVPVLQSKLRAKLNDNAKLPKERDTLIALLRFHGITD